MSVLYKSDSPQVPAWVAYFALHAPDIDFRVWPDTGPLDAVEYVIAWQAPPELLASLPNLKVVFSSGAGVDHIDLSVIADHVHIVRMVEPGIVQGMVEYVAMSVLALHRDLFDYQRLQAAAQWRPMSVRPASARTVGVMGLGVLGRAVLGLLALHGFRLQGWSRAETSIAGVDCRHGPDGLDAFLAGCDILVCLLPLTDQTRGILARPVFDALPRGASVINVGRGGHLVVQDLLDAIATGQVSRAVLDVVEPEPLPEAHPLWRHPRVVLTPHIASMTQAETAAPVLLENLRRHQRGEALRDTIDRTKGY